MVFSVRGLFWLVSLVDVWVVFDLVVVVCLVRSAGSVYFVVVLLMLD